MEEIFIFAYIYLSAPSDWMAVTNRLHVLCRKEDAKMTTRNDNIKAYRAERAGFEAFNGSGEAYRDLVAAEIMDNDGDWTDYNEMVAAAIEKVAAEMWQDFKMDAWDEAYQDDIDSGRAAERYGMRGCW